MKIIILVIIGVVFFSLLTNYAHAVCAIEALEWWQACNDTGLSNALPLNPVLLFLVFPVIIISSIIGGLVFILWRKRK